MTVTVMTLTRYERERELWLTECRDSVALTLPVGGRHLVKECQTDFQRTWWETLRAADEYVAVVDDDDRVTPDAISRCVAALETSTAGIAFTSEVQMTAQGERIPNSVRERPVSKRDIAMHPRSAHHLTVIRTACLNDCVLDLAEAIGVGIEWLTTAWCTFNAGFVHVPMIGYEWRQHENCLTNRNRDKWREAMPRLRQAIHPWYTEDFFTIKSGKD